MHESARTDAGVLIVDDETELLEEMAATLAEEGFNVLTAASAAAALQAFESGAEIGVVVTDIRMPEVDGLELVERISALDRRAKPQVVVLTGHGTMETVIRALRLHAVDFLNKPVTRPELAGTVRSAMDRWLLASTEAAGQEVFQRRYAEQQQALARINATLTRLLAGEDIIAAQSVAEAAAPQAPAAAAATSRSARVRAMLREHRLRARVFHDSTLLDPTWEMLLELTLAHLEGRQTYLTGLCVASGLPITTAIRRVDQLVQSGLIRRSDDPIDKRRVLVSLTEAGLTRLSEYLAQVERDTAKGGPRNA